MSEYYKYFNEIIENTYDLVSPIVKEINNIGACPNCGGHYIKGTCKYCRTKNEKLEQLVNDLEIYLKSLLEKLENLPIKNININKLFNLLYTCKNIEDSLLNELFTKYNYEEVFQHFFEQNLERLNNCDNEFTPLEMEVFETAISVNKHPELNRVYDFFIRNALLKKQNVSFDSFCIVIKHFTESQMKIVYPTVKCQIVEKIPYKICNSKVVGESSYNKITLSKELVKELYNNENFEILITIFHELIHTMQWKEIFTSKDIKAITPLMMTELMEYILTREVSGYYNENYDKISYENEANSSGLYILY